VNWQDLTNPLSGGAEVHLQEILTRVVGWGHQVTLACSGYKNCKSKETIDGLEIWRRGSRNNFNYVAPALVRNILKDNPHDIIVEDINKIPFYLPLFFKMPHLAVIPHLFGKNIYQETNAVLASYVYFAEKPIPRVYNNSGFLAISESTKDDLISRGIRKEKVGVAECGLDHSFYTADRSVARFERPTITYLGRLKKYKSVQHLVEALPKVRVKVPEARVLIVGDGDFMSELKGLANSLNIADAVEFTGYVSPPKKLEYLRKSHISIYPSPKEGWGITNIEANACGTPVVAADSPGLRDSVNTGKSGLLYKYGDIDDLAAQIVKLLTDQQLYNSLCQGAIEWAKKFTWEDCARRSFECMEKTYSEWGKQ
jgi:glycosyltransferase involved in cell wall biosynthesis